MVDYTVDRMIDSIERRAGFPIRQGLYTTDDFIQFLNEAMYQLIVPEMMTVREEYFVDSDVQTVVAGQDKYPIPSNAVGQKVRNVEFFDQGTSREDAFYSLPLVSVEDIGSYPSYQVAAGTGNGAYYQYYLEANNVVLYPRPKSSIEPTKLRIKYFRRPNELTATTNGGIITDITGTDVTLSLVPSTWTTSTELDVVKGSQPFNLVGDAITPSAVNGSVLTFSAAEVAEMSVGDSMAAAGFTIVPNLPFEAHRLLEAAGVMHLLEGADDEGGLVRAQTMYAEQLRNFKNTLTPRSDGGQKKLVSRNDVLYYTRARRGY